MLFYTVGQEYIWVAMMITGLVLGLWYDFLWLWRRALYAGWVITLLMDLVFAISAAGLLFAVLLHVAYGDLRLFAVAGAVSGGLLYGVTLSPILRRVSLALAKAMRKGVIRLSQCKIAKRVLK